MAQLNDLIVLGNSNIIGDLSLTINSLSSNGIKYLLTTENLSGSGNQNLKLHEDVYYYYGSSYSSLNVGKSTKNGIITIHNNGYLMDIKPATLSSSNKTITIPNATGTVALLEVANTFSGNNTFSGTNTFSGQVVLSRTTDAQGDEDNKPALRIGAISGTHLEFDGNEIMAKTSGTAVGPLYLNNNGGLVSIGSGGLKVSGNVEGNSTLTIDGAATLKSTLTMTGAIKRSAFPGTWVAACKGDALINSTHTAGSFSPMMSGGTTNGRMSVAFYQGGLRVGYITKANCDANTNTLAADVTLANESGGGVWPGTISAANVTPKTAGSGSVGTSSNKWSTMYATTFYGALSGNASTASKLTDITSTDIASSSATKRYVFISYNDLTTGRPAYDTDFTYQTSTDTLFVPKVEASVVRARTSATATSHGPGKSGQVLMSNGTNTYWSSETGGPGTFKMYIDSLKE